jgi:Zn-finger nucleic acid-binding protein
MEPFRTVTTQCPRCRSSQLTNGELQHCATCQGTWVSHETLSEHVSTMQVDLKPKLVWEISNARLGLPCATCGHAMEPLRLFDVPVDRCKTHGVWFDKDELAAVLQRSGAHVEPKPTAEPAKSDTSALEVVGDVVGGVAGGIVAITLEVLGGIFELIDF